MAYYNTANGNSKCWRGSVRMFGVKIDRQFATKNEARIWELENQILRKRLEIEKLEEELNLRKKGVF